MSNIDNNNDLLHNQENKNEFELFQMVNRNKNYRTVVNNIEFEWDTLKNKKTINKHGISFEEAAEIFSKPDTIIEYDEDHSDLEDRWNAIGYSTKQRALIVCHCYKENNIIRIITARKASKEDIDFYNEQNS